MLLKILLAGDGGQGIQTIGSIIAEAAFQNNWQVSLIPNYGLEQRGGASLVFIQISGAEIAFPKFSKPDILVILSETGRGRVKNYFAENIKIFDYADYSAQIGKEILLENTNVFFLGTLTRFLEGKKIIAREQVVRLLEEKLSKKKNWENNKNAFNFGSILNLCS